MIETISLEFVCDKAADMPCAPDLIPGLLALMNNPDSSSTELSKLLARDAGTTAAVLRMANSSFYLRLKCESLDDAILRIGRIEVYKIVSNCLVRKWFSAQSNIVGLDPHALYAHACAVAIAAEIIAKDFGRDPKVAYTAGLLHDIGKLGMAHACGQHFSLVHQLQEVSPKSIREIESVVFGFDHTEVGAALLRRWLFHPSLVQVVEFYPRPRMAGAAKDLVLTVHAAKNIVISLGLDINDGFHYDLDAEYLVESGFTQEYVDSVVPRIGAALVTAGIVDK
ncbi:MAG: HDOD domain-containing protein [Verrucomicrobiae bacterium]